MTRTRRRARMTESFRPRFEQLEDRLAPAILVQSSFDTNDESWRIGELFSNSGDSVPTYLATGGNPGGAIRTTDTAGVTAFQAPAGFLGDQSAAYGGTMHLEQRLLSADGPHYPMVLLSDGTLFLQFRTPPPGTAWTAYDIPLLASAGWEVSNLSDTADADLPASEAQLRQVLSSLTLLNLRADWRSGADQVDLDNVRLESADVADLAVAMSVAPDPAVRGDALTYTITTTNHGPTDATNVTLTTAVPAQTSFISFTPLGGGTTTTPPVGGGGAVTSIIPLLAAGASASFLFLVGVDSGDAPAIISASAAVNSAVNDLDLSNNTTAVTTDLFGTVRWNTDNDGMWNDPTNWNSGFVPRSGDNVIIDRPGVENVVTIPQGDFAIAGLSSQEKLIIAGGGSLTLTRGAQLSGLDIQVDADLIIDTADPVNGIAGDWNNAGRIAWIGSGRLVFTQGADLNNLAGSILEIHTAEPAGAEPAGISFQGGGNLNNVAGGVIEVDPADPAGMHIAHLVNQGTVLIPAGILKLAGGVSTGRFETAVAAQVTFTGGFVWNDGTTFVGTGSVLLDYLPGPEFNVTVDGNVGLSNLLVLTGGEIKVQSGTLTIGDGSSSNSLIYVAPGAGVNFVGRFTWDHHTLLVGPGSIRVDPPEPANAVVTVYPFAECSRLDIGRYGTVQVDGVLKVYDIINNAGTLSGKGRIRGNVRNAGVISPDGSFPGILTIDGNYTQTRAGSLVIDVRSKGEFDKLKVTGTARLAGKLTVVFSSKYRPQSGDQLLVLRCSFISGNVQVNKPALQLTAGGFLIRR